MRGTLLVSEWFYGALLNLYPAGFRSAYGEQMRLTFRDTCRDAYHRGGAGGLLALWLPTLLDLFKSALEERARRGEITMSKERLISWAGPLTVIVGALMMGGLVGDIVWLVRPSEALWEFFHFQLVTVTFVLMLPAFIATRLRYQEDARRLGRLGLILSVAGSAGMWPVIAASFLVRVREPDPLQQGLTFLTVICGLSILIGHILFGIDALRYKLLLRWNATPLLVGLTAPLLSVLSTIIGSALRIDQYQFEPKTVFLQSSITGVWWVMMGIAMMAGDWHRQRRVEARAVSMRDI